MRHSQFLCSLALFAGLSHSVLAQAPAPAAPRNLIGNPGFETGFRRDNLWDGVDASGFLAGERGALPVLTTSGTIADTSMPISVSVADMNGDSLLDIATMDILGYLRIFFNSGTKEAPAFTVGELSTLFLSRFPPSPLYTGPRAEILRQGQRIHLTDMMRSGRKDLVIGNYFGEIFLIPNAGSGARPEFRQPADVGRMVIPTMKNSNDKWGNVFAPVTWDWNRDSRDDLLVGEGSYSANSIHLLVNQGTGARPQFDENNRTVLAYGMGLEQLTPCIVDFNGDGHMDLLVTERTGKVAVYLNSGQPWKPGETLAFSHFIGGTPPAAGTTADPLEAAKASGLLSLGGIATLAAGDFNGDGLFDLVFGKSNGKVAMALNTGSKTAPKFSTPTEVKGQAGTTPFNLPSGWEVDFGLARGNFNGFVSVVKAEEDDQAQPFEGKAALKAGYVPSINKFMPAPNQYTPGFPNFRPTDLGSFRDLGAAPANFFRLSQGGRGPLLNNKTYIFSMRVKGTRASNGGVRIGYSVTKRLGEDRVERGGRDSAVVRRNEVREEKDEVISFNAGAQWTEVRKEFTVRFDNRDLRDVPQVGSWTTDIIFSLSPGDGVLYIDDVSVMEKP
ncbi:MAG: VCBS repeat-containing protein [Terrimicrobiaceae bacterium]|nr:VCBS repeat-containing protein [Terrimicrobiaceae bacterium]